MYAGVQGQGAQDGWYETALMIEAARLDQQHITGAAADVHKCFDQVQRGVFRKVLEVAGTPKKVREPCL